MENIIPFVYAIAGILLGWFGNYGLSYMKEKGGNLATKEDIKEITKLVESVHSEYAASLELIKTDLSIYQQKHLSLLQHKFDIYQTAINPAIKLIAAITTQNSIDPLEFEQKRLEAHLQLALVTSQPVLNSYDSIVDYIFDYLEGKEERSWPKIRELGFKFINEVRKDIGLNVEPVTYEGRR
jgi:hypothetical protein